MFDIKVHQVGPVERLRWWVAEKLTGIDREDLQFARQLYAYERAMTELGLAVQRARMQSGLTQPEGSSGASQADPVGSGAKQCPTCGSGIPALRGFSEPYGMGFCRDEWHDKALVRPGQVVQMPVHQKRRWKL